MGEGIKKRKRILSSISREIMALCIIGLQFSGESEVMVGGIKCNPLGGTIFPLPQIKIRHASRRSW